MTDLTIDDDSPALRMTRQLTISFNERHLFQTFVSDLGNQEVITCLLEMEASAQAKKDENSLRYADKVAYLARSLSSTKYLQALASRDAVLNQIVEEQGRLQIECDQIAAVKEEFFKFYSEVRDMLQDVFPFENGFEKIKSVLDCDWSMKHVGVDGTFIEAAVKEFLNEVLYLSSIEPGVLRFNSSWKLKVGKYQTCATLADAVPSLYEKTKNIPGLILKKDTLIKEVSALKWLYSDSGTVISKIFIELQSVINIVGIEEIAKKIDSRIHTVLQKRCYV
jgi:hypothetical protein